MARELAPARLRSRRIGAASQPSGSKRPRHNNCPKSSKGQPIQERASSSSFPRHAAFAGNARKDSFNSDSRGG
ncbi:hypothetical protein FHJ31_03765 [Pseudomonas sp. Fig-3]|nr:hypothetical protein FHJ31_03765 [Pseudomonas sp. Fig-3]